MTPNQDFTQTTIDAVKSAALLGNYVPGVGVRKDITQATGLVAYNLEPAAKLLVPQITPLRNRIPRVGNQRGGTAANWKVIRVLDVARSDVFTAEGTKAGTVSTTVVPMSAAYATVSKGDNVSFQAQWAGKTFEDIKAQAILRLLKTVMIHEEQAILGGRTSALGSVSAPTVDTLANDGAIPAAADYYLVAKAITPLGNGKASSETTITGCTSTSDWSIAAHTPWVEGAVAYDWYLGTTTGIGNSHFQVRTYINSVKLTTYNASGTVRAADDSANALAFDGILTQLTSSTAQVTTAATGTSGTGTRMTLDAIDGLFQNCWDNAKADPDVIVMNSQQRIDLTALWLAANGGPTVFVQSGQDQANITGGYVLTHYLNKITGKNVPLVTHPYLVPGTMFALTLEMPFAVGEVLNPIEVETRQEYMQIDYPLIAPKFEFEVLVDEVVKLYWPQSCWVYRNIASGH